MITSPSTRAAERRRIRAPREHGQVFIEPEWERIGDALAANRAQSLLDSGYDVHGQTLGDLGGCARREMLYEARRYTSQYRDVCDQGGHERPILLAGHQPQLFHAGVWFKNFALSTLGQAHGAWAVNLLVDNDIHRMPSLRVPTGTRDNRQIRVLPFDKPTDAIPYEEREILDRPTFDTFGARVDQAVSGLIRDPVIRQLWPLAVDAAQRSANLGRCLAEARHRLEGQWGQQTLELPLSRVCQSPWFVRFALHLLAELPRLHHVYNSCLAGYRHVNRIRSRRHPVPDLQVDEHGLEAPFWIWTAQSPHRQRLFVRPYADRLVLSDRERLSFTLPLDDPDAAVARWIERQPEGIRLRPRALITTMYGRLVLSDLFLHGIGGAKYDQLTDLIIQRFFGFKPPGYATISATALLFEDRTEALREQMRELKRLQRDLRFHPERCLVPSEEAARLASEKQAWIQKDPPRGHRLERHRAIQRINAALQQHVAADPAPLAARLAELTAELRHEVQFASREFSFCLFPEHVLRPLLRCARAAYTSAAPSPA